MAEKIPEHRPEATEKADLKHIEQMAADLGLAAAGSTPGIHAAAGITTIRPIRRLLKKPQQWIDRTACGLCKTEENCREALL